MSENTKSAATVATDSTKTAAAPYGLRKDGTPKLAPGRKPGSTVAHPAPGKGKGTPSAVRAYIMRTTEGLASLPPVVLENVLSNMAATVAKSPEFLASEECVMAPLFGRIEDVTRWEADYRMVTFRALVATADPLECAKLVEWVAARQTELTKPAEPAEPVK